ncbi:hypothetical protein STEG23_023640, partial [Scotinomys teguina]
MYGSIRKRVVALGIGTAPEEDEDLQAEVFWILVQNVADNMDGPKPKLNLDKGKYLENVSMEVNGTENVGSPHIWKTRGVAGWADKSEKYQNRTKTNDRVFFNMTQNLEKQYKFLPKNQDLFTMNCVDTNCKRKIFEKRSSQLYKYYEEEDKESQITYPMLKVCHINNLVNEENMAYIHSTIFFSSQNKGNLIICNSRNEPDIVLSR